MAEDPAFGRRVEDVRRFNRFYTRQIGVLNEGLLNSPFSLTQARVLYELAHRKRPTASALGKDLGLDAGYLSRILRDFEKKRLILRTPSAADGRRSELALTKTGRATFAPLDARSHQEVGEMLARLSVADQRRLLEAMRTVEALLSAGPETDAPYVLRSPRPGDMGWVIHRHGALYAQEYGWDERFEALVAEIVVKFVQHFDPARERCWIAERHGEPVGSVFLVSKSPRVAKLRLLLVEPSTRGLGIGGRLVRECIAFAHQVGYRKMTLWTNSILDAARRIYEKEGFRIVHTEAHTSFGHDLVSETWERNL
jgi:DNA-binding MarR family transcriptional regulator/N-acetylglutamate synthase-like GNAT family acetyltransferase